MADHTAVVAVVVNPTKLDDPDQTRTQVSTQCADAGWRALWLETTADDPGTGQARYAVDRDVDLVCALGGDGTVRAVAGSLAGTGIPLGLLPYGTGNLLARNLRLPLRSIEEGLRIALDRHTRQVDVARVTVDFADETTQAREQVFLVMAGVGFDAAVVGEAPVHLKRKLGWPAYVVSTVANLAGDRFTTAMEIDGAPTFRRRVRTVIVGNCGELTGRLPLLPDARPDDGHLDATLLAPKGAVGWLPVVVRVLTRRRRGHKQVEHHRLRTLRVHTDVPQDAQLDGDVIGRVRGLAIDVLPGALLVKVDEQAGR